ncbi:MAG: ABC-F family ATP-binding cassette domain-containing protein [Bacteroidales bacterium]|nr:ABC-F family ATP-binding cassette domain-containing protein [Bacteroidales bacterium]MDD4208864.1 ABC-F family ATP-binding cassette domain-containing protein [Bacteroidales bacterium]
MISVIHASIFFSGIPLFEDISFVVADTDRIGLVGKNGAGKTTLLRILAGELAHDKGNIVITKGHRIGYLPQEMVMKTDKNVWEETLSAFSEIKQIEAQIEKLNRQLGDISDYESPSFEKLIQSLSDLNHRLEYLDAGHIESNSEKVLLGLGFTKSEFMRPLNTFSSGWQMRVALAKILLQKPEIVLLDEPTNHLDIESIQWLENFLQNYQGAIILVSHDRTFLNKVAKRTIEITLGKIEDYNCNYSTYVSRRLERIAHQKQVFENQQKEIQAIEQFIERFRYKSTKAKQVQSRVKMLEKMEVVEVDELDTSHIHFLFPNAPNCNRVVFEAEKLSKQYDEKHVLTDVNFVIENQEKVAFIGKNGEGKTTLMRILHQELPLTSGRLHRGELVKIGYYAQNQNLLLDPSKTVFQTLDDIAVGDIRLKIRGILGSFLFSTDDIDKKVSVLSGGEKARLAIAKLLLEPYNVLLLDEPTNHLDMQSKDVLKNALLRYNGTLILVSHDRDFLQGLSDKVFEFKDKTVKVHLGDIQEYLEKRQLESLQSLNTHAHNGSTSQQHSESDTKSQWEKQKQKESALRKASKHIEKIENDIHRMEEAMEEINRRLSDPEHHVDDIASGALYKQYQDYQKKVEKLVSEWEIQCMELEKLKG